MAPFQATIAIPVKQKVPHCQVIIQLLHMLMDSRNRRRNWKKSYGWLNGEDKGDLPSTSSKLGANLRERIATTIKAPLQAINKNANPPKRRIVKTYKRTLWTN